MAADLSMKKWLVTRTETITVEAKTEDHALFIGEQGLDFFGSDTENIQVEELED